MVIPKIKGTKSKKKGSKKGRLAFPEFSMFDLGIGRRKKK